MRLIYCTVSKGRQSYSRSLADGCEHAKAKSASGAVRGPGVDAICGEP